MPANTAFASCAAAIALVISIASAVKGRWAVAIVFAMLVAGFLARAFEVRREARRAAPPPPAPAPVARRVKPARFKRR